MTKIQNTRRNQFILTLFILSAISVVYLYYSSKNPRPVINLPISPTPTPISNIRSNQPVFNKLNAYQVSFSPNLSLENFPKELPVYSSEIANDDLNNLVKPFIRENNLIQSEKSAGFWQSADKTKSLSINYTASSFTYNQSLKTNTYSQKYTLNQALSYTKDIVSRYFPNSNLIQNANNIKSYKAVSGQLEWEEYPISDSNLISIPFEQKIGDYPYYFNANVNPVIWVLVGPNNTLYNLIYISQPYPTLNSPALHKLISQEEIKTLLESGQGAILGLNIMDLNIKNPYLPPLTINSIDLEYRFDIVKKLTLPYFRFTAGFQTGSPVPTTPVTIILPAVNL